MSTYKEIHSFEDCINAAGNYGTLYNILCWLNKEIIEIDKDTWEAIENTLDDYYDNYCWDKFNAILSKFKIEMTHEDCEYTDENFIKDCDPDDENYEFHALRFIVKEILPNYWKEEK